MNICMIVHAYYLKDARVQRYSELLVEQGHHVDVLCLREKGEASYEEYLGVKIHRINISRLRGGMVSYILEYVLAFIRFFYKLNCLYLKGIRYPLIHVHNFPNFLVFTTVVQKVLGAKIILDVHDPMPELFRSKIKMDEHHPFIGFLYWEERLSTRYADFVIAANHRFKDLLEDRGCPENKVEVVLNTPDAKFTCSPLNMWNQNGKAFTILYIGTLAERYGLDIALKAVAQIKSEGRIPSLGVIIIPKIKNEGNYLVYLKQMIEGLGLGDICSFLEPVPHNQMPEIISKADVSIYTPLPDVHMDIALSLKIPEVIAVGRPLVTSRLSVLQKYFGEKALFMFEPGNVNECAQRLLEIYHHPQDVQNRIKLSQEALKGFSWDKQKEVYLKIIASITGNTGIAAK